MFEYTSNRYNTGDFTDRLMIDYLNLMGKDQWELVQVIAIPFPQYPDKIANYTFFFKRNISPK